MYTKTALLSVCHKDGIADFGQELHNFGFNLIASRGTAKALELESISVCNVADIIGSQPILGHRLVTLSWQIHAGLLARDTREDRKVLEELGVPWIDLVCVDFYPLGNASGKVTGDIDVSDMVDIGGPTLARSAAKGKRIVICDVADRARVLEWLKAGKPNIKDFLFDLAIKAERIVGRYNFAVADCYETYREVIQKRK